jgi:hypothetical protein
MSEIKKYQKAMNFKANPRYLTRDFIVPLYTGTEPDILDDSNTQRETGNYTPFPNDMPIVSPKEIQNQPYEQIELADGGSVERRGFSNAGLVSISDFSKQQKSIGQQAFQKYLVPSQTNTKGGKDLLNALSKAGIVFSDKKGPYGERYLKNVNKNTIKNFEKNIKNIREYVEVPSTIIKNNVIVGVRWPNKNIEKEYINQIKERSKYSKNSNELQEKIKSGEILSDSQLAKKFGMNYSEVVRINSQIKKDYELERPVIGRDETRKQVDIKRKEAQLKFSDPGFEKKYSGTYKAHLGHMGDLYNRMVTSKNLGYTPAEINDAMKETLDPILKNISQAQDKLVKNKPPGWKQKLEEYNKKGINYSSLAEGYKSFDITDPDTLKKYTYGVDYLKTIDPAALYEGKPIKEISELTDKREINKIQKAFDDLTEAKKIARTEGLEQADISKIKNSELLTEENLKKLQNYSAFEQNKEEVLKAQTKIPASEKRRLVQMIGSIGCPTYAIGGRVNFSEGTDCYNKGLKALEEGNLTKAQLNVAGRTIAESGDEGMLLKNLLSKAGTGFKFTGKGIGELVSIGGGPAGVIAGAALETAFAAPYLLEGDYKQALRQSIFGQVPEFLGVDIGSRDEDIIKLAKDAGVNPDSVKKYVELKKNYIENEEYGQKLNMLDEMYKRDPKNLDYVQQIRRLENKIKPSSDYLEKNVYAPKDLDKYEKDYLKAAKYFVDKNADRALLTRSEEQKKSSLRDIAQESLSAVRPEQDVENILRDEKLLPQEPETQPQEELPDYYKISAADGGRIGLKEGGGPKMGRRGFLGLLAAGAAAAPEIMKGLKGEKKAAQAAKVISKIKLEKAEGMYPWFPDLVEKIKTKGKPFEEKEIIMEASYKHEPKGYGGLPKGEETVTRHVDGDTEFLLREYPDGRIAVDIHSPRNQEGSSTPVTLYYRPTMELKYYDGVKVEPAEFKVLEKEPRYFANGPDDVDIEMSEMRKVPGKNTIFGDVEAAERFATGKIENRKIIPAKQARREQMEDAPTDFIEETSPYGPETF